LVWRLAKLNFVICDLGGQVEELRSQPPPYDRESVAFGKTVIREAAQGLL
jgi:hypothetical protein